jgi:hypothetical protein
LALDQPDAGYVDGVIEIAVVGVLDKDGRLIQRLAH